MNIEQLLEELRKTLQVNGVSHTILLHLLERCRIALSEQADLLRRAEMSVENCDMYREREASVPDALRATPVAQDEVSKLREREAFNSGYDAICRRSITNRETASRMFQAGAEWQRSQQSAPAGYRMVPVDLLERAAESIESELDARYGKPVHPALQKKYASDMVEVEEIRNLLAAPKAEPKCQHGNWMDCAKCDSPSDYDKLKDDNEKYKKLHEWLKAENERLRNSLSEVATRIAHDQRTRKATDSTLDGYLAAGISAADAERDEAKRQVAALRQHKTDYMEAAEVTRKALESELSALKAQQEPVAWRVTGAGGLTVTPEYPKWAEDDSRLLIESLYTAPQPAPAQDVAGLPYQTLFNAIAAATKASAGHVEISVAQFKVALAAHDKQSSEA